MRKDRFMDRHDRLTTFDSESHEDNTTAHRYGAAPSALNHIGPFNVWNPNAVQDHDNEICLWPVTDAALTITKITVTLDAAGNEVAGDLKWADAFIGLAGATVINAFDTTAGVLVDDSITAGSVDGGKCIYLSFDSQPHEDITQMCVDIDFTYD